MKSVILFFVKTMIKILKSWNTYSVHDKKKKKNNRRSYDDCCASNPHSANHNLSNNANSSHSSASNVDRARSRHHVSAIPPLGSPANVVNSVPLNAALPVAANQSENRFEEITSKSVLHLRVDQLLRCTIFIWFFILGNVGISRVTWTRLISKAIPLKRTNTNVHRHITTPALLQEGCPTGKW